MLVFIFISPVNSNELNTLLLSRYERKNIEIMRDGLNKNLKSTENIEQSIFFNGVIIYQHHKPSVFINDKRVNDDFFKNYAVSIDTEKVSPDNVRIKLIKNRRGFYMRPGQICRLPDCKVIEKYQFIQDN